jgi:hypothetical protein
MSAPAISTDTLAQALDTLYADFSAVIKKLDLDAPIANPGDWTPRQVLSHVLGSLNRTPVQAGYFLAGGKTVPVIFSDPYWMSMWEAAPRESFDAALRSEVEGNKGFIRSLASDSLWRTAPLTGFGEMPLGAFLQVSYQGHIHGQHLPQLQAYLKE